MKLFFSSPKKTRRFFTIPELLVVVLILVVLSLLAAPLINWTRNKALVVACMNNLRGLALASSLYQVENSEYPPQPIFGENTLPQTLARYVKDSKSFHCPVDADENFDSYSNYFVRRTSLSQEDAFLLGCPRHDNGTIAVNIFRKGSASVHPVGEVYHSEGSTLEPTVAGQSVSQGTTWFPDGSSMTIMTPGLQAEVIESFRLEGGQTYTMIKVPTNEAFGKLILDVTPGSKFEVVTPAAIAGVRGTVFMVDIFPADSGKKAVDVFVYEGKVSVAELSGEGEKMATWGIPIRCVEKTEPIISPATPPALPSIAPPKDGTAPNLDFKGPPPWAMGPTPWKSDTPPWLPARETGSRRSGNYGGNNGNTSTGGDSGNGGNAGNGGDSGNGGNTGNGGDRGNGGNAGSGDDGDDGNGDYAKGPDTSPDSADDGSSTDDRDDGASTGKDAADSQDDGSDEESDSDRAEETPKTQDDDEGGEDSGRDRADETPKAQDEDEGASDDSGRDRADETPKAQDEEDDKSSDKKHAKGADDEDGKRDKEKKGKHEKKHKDKNDRPEFAKDGKKGPPEHANNDKDRARESGDDDEVGHDDRGRREVARNDDEDGGGNREHPRTGREGNLGFAHWIIGIIGQIIGFY